jgi:serine protease Do
MVEVGNVVLAVGNPLSVGQTITMGIISAKGHSTRASFGSGSYEDFLQTDAGDQLRQFGRRTGKPER